MEKVVIVIGSFKSIYWKSMDLIALGMYSIERWNAFDWGTHAKDTLHNSKENLWTFFMWWQRFSMAIAVSDRNPTRNFDEILGKSFVMNSQHVLQLMLNSSLCFRWNDFYVWFRGKRFPFIGRQNGLETLVNHNPNSERCFSLLFWETAICQLNMMGKVECFGSASNSKRMSSNIEGGNINPIQSNRIRSIEHDDDLVEIWLDVTQFIILYGKWHRASARPSSRAAPHSIRNRKGRF